VCFVCGPEKMKRFDPYLLRNNTSHFNRSRTDIQFKLIGADSKGERLLRGDDQMLSLPIAGR
jgi:hypothetical protein